MKKIISIILTFVLCAGAMGVFADTSIIQANETAEDITVTAQGKVLQKDVDYTLSYQDNVNVGTATVTVDFIGNYSGTLEKTFEIVRKKHSNSTGGQNIVTDNRVVLTRPTTEHKAYITGHTDGKFQPESDMTRAEAAAIFARLISEKKNENITVSKTVFTDISKNVWYAGHVSYLEKYSIIKGYSDKTFRPDETVTRAEFVSMAVRYYGLFDKVNYPANTTKYSDINGKHWAVKDISFAKNAKWLNGYADGTFRPDNNITRAEVVTIVNRVTGRAADTEYINKNMSTANKFTDLKDKSYWAFYEIMEASNTHKTVNSNNGETWVK